MKPFGPRSGWPSVWIPPRSEELAQVSRREQVVIVALLVGFVALVIVGLDASYMIDRLPRLVKTIPLVLLISFWATLLACLVGFIASLGLLSERPVFYVSARMFVSLFQGVPLIVILFLLYFGLPHLNSAVLLTPIEAGILGLGLNNAAFLAEVFRSSILSVPKGQSEAAHAIGMSNRQMMRRIVLPQAARIALPPTANYYIFILKDSALVGFIGVSELFLTARSIGQRDFQVMEMLLLAGAIYWIITIVLSWLQHKIERQMGTAYVRGT